VLTASGDRPDMGRLQDRRDVRAADGAATIAHSVQDNRLEGLLAEPVGRYPRVAEHGSRPVPWLAEVQLHHCTQRQPQKVSEVRRYRWVGQVIALALHDVAGELRRRTCGPVQGKETDVADELAADQRVFSGADRATPVPADPCAHLLRAGNTVSLAEQLPGLGDPQPCQAESLKNPPPTSLLCG